MPFINGRYYVNPVMGEAMEAAREAEAALVALQEQARQNAGEMSGESDAFGGEMSGTAGGRVAANDGPIHRVEIEAAEMVPAHSGHAARGFVARVHRGAADAPGDLGLHGAAKSGTRGAGATAKAPANAETHVFADHRDLVSFLRDELAKDAQGRHRG